VDRLGWIVVGTDFSPAAGVAVEHAAELAAELGTNVAVVHAYEDPPDARLDSDSTPLLQARLEEAISPLRARYPALRIDGLVRRGTPWEKLVNVGWELRAQMIVVGAAGEGSRVNQSFLGRVVTRVAATSNRSVLVVPNAAAASVRLAEP
jgi:nucleotide-binding universal stress UspA family protein